MALHILLEKAFEFPAYYGRNWDAFDERVRDVPLPVEIWVRGIASLQSRLPREAELLAICVRDFLASERGSAVSFHVS